VIILPLPALGADASGLESLAPLEAPSGDGGFALADGDAASGDESESGLGFEFEGAGAGGIGAVPPLAGEGGEAGSGTAPAGREPAAGEAAAGGLSEEGGLSTVGGLLVEGGEAEPGAGFGEPPLPLRPLLPRSNPLRSNVFDRCLPCRSTVDTPSSNWAKGAADAKSAYSAMLSTV
jgi:hypothetical protein